MKEKGFEAGNIVFEKDQGSQPASKLFYITSLREEVHLSQVISYTDEHIVVTIPSSVFKDKWLVYKGGDPPSKIFGGQQLPAGNLYEIDEVKCQLYQALMASHCTKKVCMEGLQFYKRPGDVRTTMKTGKGQLVLAPLAPFHNISIGIIY